MIVNIYYGGRGVLDDPTIYVITRLEEALSELRVEVKRYNIFENRNQISTLPKTLNDADGVIFATTVEWLGIGGYMNQFLDSCWLYGDKEKIASLYMMPVVISTTYGEREGVLTLENAWETLGGLLCSGLCGYVDDLVLQQPCCKRSFIRGAFIVTGSISDPNKGYHFEIVCSTESQAAQLTKVMNTFDVEAKYVSRNDKFVVYLKEGAQIVEILRVILEFHGYIDIILLTAFQRLIPVIPQQGVYWSCRLTRCCCATNFRNHNITNLVIHHRAKATIFR